MRFFIEGGVIVVSILLAFAIDAWWEDRQAQEAQIERLARVAAELRVISVQVQNKLEIIESAIEATSEYLTWMGPEAAEMSDAIFNRQWTNLVSIGTFALTRQAVEDYLAAGDVDTANAEIRVSISEWHSNGNSVQGQYDLLRKEHQNVIEYANLMQSPVINTMLVVPVMEEHSESKFSFDQLEYLHDPVLENLLAVYLIRMKFVRAGLNDLLNEQNQLLASIESTIAQ